MAKQPPPPAPASSSSEEEEASSSDEEEGNATATNTKPAHRTPAENSEEEEEESESGDESSSDDDEEEAGSNKKEAESFTLATAKPASASGSESGSESDDDSDSEEAKLVAPISSRPMAEGPAFKRSDGGEPANGKALFQRIWTSDDEIAILNGMVRFQSDHGVIKLNPNTIGDFLGFIKGSLSFEVSGNQLVDKIRRLKKKYSVVAARSETGKALKFAKGHDQAVYDLSKKVWGKEDDHNDEHEVIGTPNGVAMANGGGTSLKRQYPFLRDAVAKMGNCLAVEAMEKMDPEKARVLDKKLKKQRMSEFKQTLHKLDLRKETLKLIMDGAERVMD